MSASTLAVPPSPSNVRLSMLLWGQFGCGKTTLAATAPGRKLWLCVDPDGDASLIGRDDVVVMKLYDSASATVMTNLRGSDPYQLTKYLQDNPDVLTVVFDSLTVFADMALRTAVIALRKPTITVELPTEAGWSYRNSIILSLVMTLMQITSGLKRNLILITHETTPNPDDKSVTMILSGSLANRIGLRINETWHLRDSDGKQRTISVRAHTRIAPMKTRMFDTRTTVQFPWNYDAVTKQGEGIADWWDAWRNNGGKQLPLPPLKGGQKMPPTA